ncbi:NADPH-dependent diflavin oxidoreductase 1 [Chelonus insularis]|uniref:NADPH-dependent diflavin oxidoreductase 1 n=1 Tax=Chelonus insularis TaxID=460826 RepID=UPI00158B084A|nr:NADPH-dependent diflavin oxidoreductase 1 [Chelonus insularis]
MTMSTKDFYLTILYGSETGTAQDTAEGIWKSAKRFGLKCSVMAMDDYNIENLISERLIVFVVATTGQGEVPTNMRKFWRMLLRKSLPNYILGGLTFAVLGLGDSSYDKYNYAARKLQKRILQLGGTELIPLGLADDQDALGIDETIDPWTKDLWSKISIEFDLLLKRNSNNDSELIERFDVSILRNVGDNEIQETLKFPRDIYREELEINDQLKVAKLIDNSRITSEDHFQDVRLIKLGVQNVDYEPGDVIYIRPKNSPEQVKDFFNILTEHEIPLYPDTILKINEKEIILPHVLKKPITLEQLAEQYWDLSYKPRRSTMKILASISDNNIEREKFIEFTTTEGQEDLYNYINRPRRNILELLHDFPHTTKKLNEKILFELMMPIKPRAFSIASSNKYSPNEVHLLVAIVEYKTIIVKPRIGLCSNWLKSLEINDEILFTIQKGTFRFDYTKPMILIGPGTGLAAFRSMLLERAALKHDLHDTVLFFGCRNKEKDFHCRKNLENLVKENNLKLFCAFSRDQTNKIYVQNIIHQQQELCWDLLTKGGKIYLSGSSKNMPKAVKEEFIEIAKTFGNLDDNNAVEFVKKLEATGRYQTETWS